MDELFHAQLETAATAEQAEAAEERPAAGGEAALVSRTDGQTVEGRSVMCGRTAACTVPLVQLINPLEIRATRRTARPRRKDRSLIS